MEQQGYGPIKGSVSSIAELNLANQRLYGQLEGETTFENTGDAEPPIELTTKQAQELLARRKNPHVPEPDEPGLKTGYKFKSTTDMEMEFSKLKPGDRFIYRGVPYRKANNVTGAVNLHTMQQENDFFGATPVNFNVNSPRESNDADNHHAYVRPQFGSIHMNHCAQCGQKQENQIHQVKTSK
jgi:hypothetical protein